MIHTGQFIGIDPLYGIQSKVTISSVPSMRISDLQHLKISPFLIQKGIFPYVNIDDTPFCSINSNRKTYFSLPSSTIFVI